MTDWIAEVTDDEVDQAVQDLIDSGETTFTTTGLMRSIGQCEKGDWERVHDRLAQNLRLVRVWEVLPAGEEGAP